MSQSRVVVAWIGLLLAGACTAGPQAIAAAPLQSAIDTRVQTQKEGIETQARIDRVADETERLLEEYRQIIAQVDSLQAYNEQLERLIHSQEEALASLEKQLGSIETTQRRIVPLMLRMVEVLESFVALDLPFLPEERALRVAHLKALMNDAEVALAEKFRRVLEAYQVEMDYGRTLEAYRGTLAGAQGTRTVDFLRIGRLALFYRTFDGQEVGRWDRDTRSWQRLPAEYAGAIAQGLHIARKEAPPDLLELPVPAPEVVQ